MTDLKQLAQNLRNYNAWRRGDGKNANIEMPHPIDLGTWIDSAIAVVEAHAKSNVLARRVEKLEADRDALAAELAALREQEPVAFMHDQETRRDCVHIEVLDFLQRANSHYGCVNKIQRIPLDTTEHYTIPLYARPVPARRMTDDEINDLGFQCGLQPEDAVNPSVEEFARAIEAALFGGELQAAEARHEND